MKIGCPVCMRQIEVENQIHPRGLCSKSCLDIFKKKEGTATNVFSFYMRHKKGRGKSHCQWITTQKGFPLA
jgi:predicted nucleic acid-binding Zn ribbon protein